MIWDRSNLGNGEKFNIRISFPKNSFQGTVAFAKKPGFRLPTDSKSNMIIFFIIIVVILGTMGICIHRQRSSLAPGEPLYYGNGGRIVCGGHRWLGHGGFSSCACACACACAGCACACACAGGGAAGCERKITAKCLLCNSCQRKENCYLWQSG